MLIFSLDTTSNSGSFAIINNDEIKIETLINTELNHSETIMSLIENNLHIAKIEFNEIDFFSTTIGPGMFTSLRIGNSIIQGLSLATKKPIVGISSLDALASNYPLFNTINKKKVFICPIIDAKKNEIYTALYEVSTDGLHKITNDIITDPKDFLKSLKNGKYIFLGNWVIKYEILIKKILRKRAIILSKNFHFIKASIVGSLGLKKISSGQFLDICTFKPIYLR